MVEHIAFVMDGNRRWAKKRGLLNLNGHKEGANTIRRVVSFCLKNKISYLSLYTFSLENFRRSKEEKSYLFSLIVNETQKGTKQFVENGVRVRFIGDRSVFPDHVLPVCEKIEKDTAHLSRLNLNFLFCYGARQEILNGVKNIAKKVKTGEINQADISDELFEQHLWTSGIPEPDLIVRTGDQVRLSNFLLYQSAYSEFYFFDFMWPDLTEVHLQEVMRDYKNRKRNFGI